MEGIPGTDHFQFQRLQSSVIFFFSVFHFRDSLIRNKQMEGQWKNCVHILPLSQTLLEQWSQSPDPLRHTAVVLLNRNSFHCYIIPIQCTAGSFTFVSMFCLFRKNSNFSSYGIVRLCMISAERSTIII